MIRVVKFVSIALGALIVVALALLGYGLFIHDKAPNLNPPPLNAVAPAQVPSVASPPANFLTIPLNQPPGSAIARTEAAGGWVYLTVTGGGEPDRVLVVDVPGGRILATIGLGNADSLPPRPGG